MSYVGFLWFWVFALHLSHCAILCHMSRSGTEALVRFRNRTGFPALHEAAELEKLQGLNKKRTKFGRVVAGRICRAPSSRKAERRPRPQGRQPKRRCRQSANSRCSAWAHIGSDEPGKLVELPAHHAAAPNPGCVQSSQVSFHVFPMAKGVHGLCKLPCRECWPVRRPRPHLDGDGNTPDASDVPDLREGLDDITAVRCVCIEVKASLCTLHMSADSF